MSLGGYFNDLVTGNSFGSSDAATAAGNAATDQLMQLDQQKAQSDLDNNVISQDQYNAIIAKERADFLTQNQADAETNAQALDQANQELAAGGDPIHVNQNQEIGGAVVKSFKDTLNAWWKNAKNPFGAIPWEWLVLAGVV